MAYIPPSSRHHIIPRKAKHHVVPKKQLPKSSKHHVVGKTSRVYVKTDKAGNIIAVAPKIKQTKAARVPGKPVRSRARKVHHVIQRAVSNYVAGTVTPHNHHVVGSKAKAPTPTPKSFLSRFASKAKSLVSGVRRRIGF